MKASTLRWRQKNEHRLSTMWTNQSRKWRRNNPAKAKAYNEQYHLKHREQILNRKKQKRLNEQAV